MREFLAAQVAEGAVERLPEELVAVIGDDVELAERRRSRVERLLGGDETVAVVVHEGEAHGHSLVALW